MTFKTRLKISLILIFYGLSGETFATTALRSLRFLQFLRLLRVDRRQSNWSTVKKVLSDNSSELLTAYYFAFLVIIFGSYID